MLQGMITNLMKDASRQDAGVNLVMMFKHLSESSVLVVALQFGYSTQLRTLRGRSVTLYGGVP